MFKRIIAHEFLSASTRFHRHYSIALMSVSDDSSITLLKILSTSFVCINISSMDADTFIVSTYNHERPVRTIDLQGNVGDIQHKLLPGKAYDPFSRACDYISSTNTLVYSGRFQHTVYICDLTSGEGHVIKSDKIVQPTCVCAGPAGTVFVCCGGTSTLVQLSQDGEILMTHDVGMGRPYAVSLNRDGTRLIVSNNKEGQSMIKLFHVS